MNHDYFALQIHQSRMHDLQAEARHDRVVREALRARRVLARLGTPASVLPFRRAGQPEVGQPQGRDAA